MNRSITGRILLSRSFLLGFFSYFFLWISFDLFILFPLFILRIGGTAVDVGFQNAIFFFPSVLMRPLAGWLTDRIGRLKVLWFGTLLMILTSFPFLLLEESYAQVKWWIALFLLLRGAGFAAFYVAFFTYIVDLSLPDNRARIIGMFGVSGLVAHGIAPRIGEIVLNRFAFDGFFVFSGLLASAGLVISVFLKEAEREPVPKRSGLIALKEVTLSRKNWIILPGAFVFGYVLASFNTFGAAYLQEVGNARTGYFFLVYGLVAAMVRILFGGIADRYDRGKLISIFFALQAAGLYLIVVPPVEQSYLLSAAICGGAHGILFPSMTAMAIDAHPDRVRGLVTSVFSGSIELGFSLGSYILGVVISIGSYRSMFVSTSVIALLYALYVLLLRQAGARLKPAPTNNDPDSPPRPPRTKRFDKQ